MLPLLTEMTGTVLTVTELVAVFAATQPAALVPLTVYDVVLPGDTVNAFLPCMVYVLAPDG